MREGFFNSGAERTRERHFLTADPALSVFFSVADGRRASSKERETKRRTDARLRLTSSRVVIEAPGRGACRHEARASTFDAYVAFQSIKHRINKSNQSTFASLRSSLSSAASSRSSSFSFSAAYASASAHTGAVANPASPPLILGGCA